MDKHIKVSKRGAAMKNNQTSLSAQGIAFFRAFESERPEDERICFDPYARRMIGTGFYLLCKLFTGYGEARAPGVYGYLAARTRYIDDYLQACLAEGIEQLVILGVGLDSRAYRFAALEKQARVFEVDLPATLQFKMDKVKRIFAGQLPRHVTYVPIDFNSETLQKLFDFDYSASKKTLFIWEGVVYYLESAAVDSTLEFVSSNAAKGSNIIFDYVYTSALAEQKRGEIKRMQRYSRFTGEGLIFGIEEGKIGEFMAQRGFTDCVDANAVVFKRLYFTGKNQNRTIAATYAITHAAVK